MEIFIAGPGDLVYHLFLHHQVLKLGSFIITCLMFASFGTSFFYEKKIRIKLGVRRAFV